MRARPANGYSLCASVSATMLALASCHGSPVRQVVPRSDIRHLIIEGAYRCGTPVADPKLHEALAHQHRALLNAVGTTDDSVETGSELLHAVGRPDPRPLVVLYVGHASNKHTLPAQSELCLADGRLKVDAVLEAVDPHVTSFMLILDGCFTADVDPRKSPVPTAVLSASNRWVRTGSEGGGPMGSSLIEALRCGDTNSDGIIDDGELLAGMLRAMDQPPTFEPRLRRQSWIPIPVLRTRSDNHCGAQQSVMAVPLLGPAGARALSRERALQQLHVRELQTPEVFWDGDATLIGPNRLLLEGLAPLVRREKGPLLRATKGFRLTLMDADHVQLQRVDDGIEMAEFSRADLPRYMAQVEAGNWATLHDDFVWHGGYVGNRIVTVDGVVLDARQLTPTPCCEAFGQCFVLGHQGSSNICAEH
jgi:hypothetical protein